MLRFAALILFALASPALAQQPAQPLPPPLPPVAAPAPAVEPGMLYLSAEFAGEKKPVRSGLVWRVFSAGAGDAGRPLATSTEATPGFRLEPGAYIVHVGYGMASQILRVTVGQRMLNERVTLSAGGLKLGAAIGQASLPQAQMNFSIYAPLPNNSEGRLVADNVKVGEVVRLPEGAYHVVSTYGDTNSIMRVDLKVESGKVLEATINHRAATVTLKLVSNPGGEALAGTAFSVLTPGGDIIREAIGAFPSLILAEGEYVVIARHQGKVYQRPFKVDSGLDRDIEVLAR